MTPTFDNQAAAYNRWFTTPLGRLVDKVEKQALFELTPEVQSRRLLEVGCGTGNFALELARRGAQVVGLDCSGPMLALARAKSKEQNLSLAWVRGQASYLPFAAESFAGVLCILALDFMSDREAVLQEMVRVLAPEGFLAVAILNRFSLWTLRRIIRAWFKPTLWREVRFLTPKELERLLARNQELVEIRRRWAVYFPPWATRGLVRYYPYLEDLGKRLNLAVGAFLAVTARKKGNPAPPFQDHAL